MSSIGGPLLPIGVTATFILSTAGGGLLEPTDMRRHLVGRRAVLAAEALPAGVDADYEGHASYTPSHGQAPGYLTAGGRKCGS